MGFNSNAVDGNTASENAVEQGKHCRTLRPAEAVRHLEIVFVPYQQSVGIGCGRGAKSLLNVINAAATQPGTVAQTIRPIATRVKHLVHNVPGVQLAGEMSGYRANMVSHYGLTTAGRKLRSHPSGESLVPEQCMSSYLQAVGGTKCDEA